MHCGGGNFCVGDVWLRWGKEGLGRCVAAIEWCRQEGVPGKMQWLCGCVGCGSVAIDPPPPNSGNRYEMVLVGCKLNKTIEFFCFSVLKKLHTLEGDTCKSYKVCIYPQLWIPARSPTYQGDSPQHIMMLICHIMHKNL